MNNTPPPTDPSSPVSPGAPQGPQIIAVEPARAPRPWAALLFSHAVGLALAGVALFFTLWFALTNPGIVQIFRWLTAPWSWGASFDGAGLAWGAAGVLLFTLVGWAYLEGLEIYIPRGARLALAFLFGMGLSGFVFECLAIPYLLTRPWAAGALGLLVAGLLARAWLRGRRLPESGYGGGAEWREQAMRRVLAREAFAASLVRPRSRAERAYAGAVLALLGLVTFFIFWHALLYPEVYWDSLILYLGYARQTFLAHGFPVKVTGQVGIGLGANYPHLFSVLGSGVAALAGQWSELPQRLIAPLCGVATTLLVYQSALRLTRHVGAALTVALLYRATPLGIIYDQYASDYALVLLFTAAFLYLALLYIETGLRGYLSSSALLIALAMHLNYLMGILWLPWAIAIVLAHTGAARRAQWRLDPSVMAWAGESPWALLPSRTPLREFLGSWPFWRIVLLAGIMGSTWYIRNWIVTGNPVYAFFYKILGGKHINDAVMQASAIEWTANGSGIGRLGGTLAERLRNSWGYFAGPFINAEGQDAFWMQYYQTAPLTLGFAATGLIVWLGRVLAAPLGRGKRPARWGAPLRFGWVAAALLFALLAFHYVLAPFYLYQIIGILPCLALLAALAWPFWRPAPWRHVLAALALWVGVVPGLACALMGYKVVNLVNPRTGDSQMNLFPLRHPLPEPQRMYEWRYGDDARMWEYINKNLVQPGRETRLLTHENRDLPLDPAVTIVNLDDWTDQWNIQALWDLPQAERVRRLVRDYNIHYYLYVPNELACPTNARMGTAEWEKLGLAKLLVKEFGENEPNPAQRIRLYELTPRADNAVTSAPAAGNAKGNAKKKPSPRVTPKPTPRPTPRPKAASKATTSTTKTMTLPRPKAVIKTTTQTTRTQPAAPKSAAKPTSATTPKSSPKVTTSTARTTTATAPQSAPTPDPWLLMDEEQ